MLIELLKQEYTKVRHLFRALEDSQPMCTAVLEGIHPGKVFVNDPGNPRTAYLQTFISNENEPQWGFLVGDTGDEEFNRNLNRDLFRRQIVRESVPLVFFTCDSPQWAAGLEQVFTPHPLIATPRRHYVCSQLDQDWTTIVPEGFRVMRMDHSLLKHNNLDMPEEVQGTLRKWRSIEDPRFADFGFVAIDTHQNPERVAAWATVDFVANHQGDLGMFTREDYRNRGLALVTSAACLSHGLEQGLNKIFWTCMEDNPGSIHTAEKLGLIREADYEMYMLIFDALQHQAALAYNLIGAGRHQEAAEILEQVIASEEQVPDWVFYDAACAWTALGDHGKAMDHLNSLAERGSSDAMMFEQNPDFSPLRELPQWEEFIEKIRKNNQTQ